LGDALNFTLCIDERLHNELENETFDSSVFNLATPFEISKDLAYPKPAVSTMANWIGKEENTIDPLKWQKMKESLLILSD